jgi:hypothetical protein
VVADALSRLEINETPFEDTEEKFLGTMECFAKAPETNEFHPLNYQHLKIAQDKDKTMQKILKMKNTQYVLKDFHGGGKVTPLVCNKEKIVIPGLLQKHVIMWYHTTLCHPGINHTEETIGQHLWWKEMQNHITNYVKICHLCQETKVDKRNMVCFLPKKQKQHHGINSVLTQLVLIYNPKERTKGFNMQMCNYD